MPRKPWEANHEPIKPGEKLWVRITYEKQSDGKIACTLTSNVPLTRGVDFFDMKVYVNGKRVFKSFPILPGNTIHIDVYASGGEGTVDRADYKVTEHAIELVSSSGSVEFSVLPATFDPWVSLEKFTCNDCGKEYPIAELAGWYSAVPKNVYQCDSCAHADDSMDFDHWGHLRTEPVLIDGEVRYVSQTEKEGGMTNPGFEKIDQ